MNDNLFHALRGAFPEDLSQTAIETADGATQHYSWGDLERGTAMLANLLQSLELPANARVLVQTEKSVEALMLYLAVLRAGLVYVPLNNAYQASELEYFIGDAEPSVVVCASKHFGWISKIAFRHGTRHVYTLDDDRTGSLLQRAAHHGEQQTPAQRSADDLATIIYTSGTTGRSKGAMLSHGNLLSNARVLQALWGWRSASEGGDVLIHALPLFHVHGLFVAVHGALLNGSKMIWFSKFDARAVTARLGEATVFMGVPTLYVRLLAEPAFNAEACRTMRLFISGSAPLLADTHRQFLERCGHTILERYGMSETGMLASNPYHDRDGARFGGTVGKALPGVSIRITGEDGQPCKVGEIGLIEVKGPNIFKGYWQMPDKTKEEFTADGWFRTGDMGRLGGEAAGVQAPEDYVSIVGRGKDLIISGGFNVYPKEIEGFIDDISGVEESAVVGVPHPDFGEVSVAVVVVKVGAILDASEIQSFLKTKIANFKVPKKVVIVKELPRNTMGKVQKNLLREEFRGCFIVD
jgi:malonyl-CoA/methylmalonyl-CoA synthetase